MFVLFVYCRLPVSPIDFLLLFCFNFNALCEWKSDGGDFKLSWQFLPDFREFCSVSPLSELLPVVQGRRTISPDKAGDMALTGMGINTEHVSGSAGVLN